MSKIVNLKQYDLVFSTSFFYTHGVSGHLYEMIDYFYICSQNGINCAILLADGVPKERFETAVKDKYNFTSEEQSHMFEHTYECVQPKIIMAQNVCLVDGSWRILNCTMYANNVFLLRCSESDFSYFHNHKSIKRAHVMQDFKLYPERFEDLDISVVDYRKKILWSKYHQPKNTTENTALLYLTTSTRADDIENIKRIIAKQICDNYLIVTNEPKIYASLVSNNIAVEEAPVKNILERFDTYIYTPTKWKSDCSPRFIVECAVYGKQVVYEIDYECKGIDRRREDIAEDLAGLELKNTDFFISYVKEQMEKYA